jgi:hypothetical protein
MESRPKKLLDQVRDAIRVKHYALNTEQAYGYWIKKYIIRASREIPQRQSGMDLTICFSFSLVIAG